MSPRSFNLHEPMLVNTPINLHLQNPLSTRPRTAIFLMLLQPPRRDSETRKLHWELPVGAQPTSTTLT
jgi:hypothetical protein